MGRDDFTEHYLEAFESLGLDASLEEVNAYLVENYGHTASKSNYQRLRSYLMTSFAATQSSRTAPPDKPLAGDAGQAREGLLSPEELTRLVEQIKTLCLEVGGVETLARLIDIICREE